MNTTQRTLRNRHALLVVTLTVIACVLPLAACTSTPPKMPQVVWQNGKAPSGPYEDSKWVKAARKADVARNAAWNAGDFRMPELSNIDNTLLITPMYHNAQYDARKGFGTRYPGPTPATVTSVKWNKALQFMQVTMCAASNWTIDRKHPTPPADLKGAGVEYDLNDFGDGVNVLTMGDLGECTLKGPAIGYFKPTPDPTESRKPSDIKGPKED